MPNLKSFLNKIDIYGEEIKLTIESKEKINTDCGGIFTIITFLGLILFSWFIGNDIIYKVQPISYLDFSITEDYPSLDLKRNLFPLAFSITDIANKPIKNESLITFKFIKLDFKFNKNDGFLEFINMREINLVQCNKSHFPTITESQFDGASLSSFYCPEFDDNFVEGYWSQSVLTYLSFSVKKCDYDMYPEKCEKKENIDKYISSLGLNYNFITIENIVSVRNYENPIVPTVLLSYKFLHYENLKITNFMIQKNILFTDNAFFSTSQQEIKFGKLVELQTDLLKIDSDTKEMAQMNFYSSNRSDHFFRKYIKITDILASVGGLIKVFMIFFSILLKPVIFLEKTKKLFNHIKSNEIGRDFFKKIMSNDKINLQDCQFSSFKLNCNPTNKIDNFFEKNFKLSSCKPNRKGSTLEKNQNEMETHMEDNFFYKQKNQDEINELPSTFINNKMDNHGAVNEIKNSFKRINFGIDSYIDSYKKSFPQNLVKEKLVKYQELLGIKYITLFKGLLTNYICPNNKSACKYKEINNFNKKIVSLLDCTNLLLKIIELETKMKDNIEKKVINKI